jgi:hypothetical protein
MMSSEQRDQEGGSQEPGPMTDEEARRFHEHRQHATMEAPGQQAIDRDLSLRGERDRRDFARSDFDQGSSYGLAGHDSREGVEHAAGRSADLASDAGPAGSAGSTGRGGMGRRHDPASRHDTDGASATGSMASGAIGNQARPAPEEQSGVEAHEQRGGTNAGVAGGNQAGNTPGTGGGR